MSRSTYRVTSFIDFDPYLQYFANFELYLEKFLKNLESFVEDPVFREFKWGSSMARSGDEGVDCSKRPKCEIKTLLFEVRNQNARMEAYRLQREQCIARHFQVCLALKQFDLLLNVTLQVYQNFEKVKNRFPESSRSCRGKPMAMPSWGKSERTERREQPFPGMELE